MSNIYRDDSELEFLALADNELLGILSNCLIKDSDGKLRRTETLTNIPSFKNAQKTGNYRKVWKLIAGELQHFGGDTFVNFFRKSGVLYSEIVKDVSSILNIENRDNKGTIELEKDILEHFFKISWDEFDEMEKENILSELNIDKSLKNEATDKLIRTIGFINVATLISKLVAQAISIQIISKTAINATIPKLLASSVALPITAAVTILSTVQSFSGAAYRVTIPSVVFIATMRQKYLTEN